MAEIDLKRLRELEAKATPGEWHSYIGSDAPQPLYPGVVCFACSPELKAYVVTGGRSVSEHEANARLVAELRNAAPAILDELERLRARCEELRFRMLCSVHQEPGIVSCACCWKRWDDGAPERHDVACVAAPDGATE